MKETENVKVIEKEETRKVKRKNEVRCMNLSVSTSDHKFITDMASKLNNKKKVGGTVYPQHVVRFMVDRMRGEGFEKVLEMVVRPKDIVDREYQVFSQKNPGKTQADFFAELIKFREKSNG